MFYSYVTINYQNKKGLEVNNRIIKYLQNNKLESRFLCSKNLMIIYELKSVVELIFTVYNNTRVNVILRAVKFK